MTMQFIASQTGTGSSSTITFSSIPQTFTHLQIRAFARGTAASTWDGMTVRFNSDSGSNYAQHYIYGNGGSAVSNGQASQTSAYVGSTVAGGNQTAGLFGVAITDILDYANTSKYKVTRTLNGVDANGSGYVEIDSGLWMNTAAISSITIILTSNYATGSRIDLYGITTSELTGA